MNGLRFRIHAISLVLVLGFGIACRPPGASHPNQQTVVQNKVAHFVAEDMFPASTFESTDIEGQVNVVGTSYLTVESEQGDFKERYILEIMDDHRFSIYLHPARKGALILTLTRPGYLSESRRFVVGNADDRGEWRIYPGDVDGNGVIDKTDLKLVVHFARPSLTEEELWGYRDLTIPKGLPTVTEFDCDFDENGHVDAADVKLLLGNLGRKVRH